MSALQVYLRCKNDHANSVPMSDRFNFIGRPCTKCGEPLVAEPERERGPPRRY